MFNVRVAYNFFEFVRILLCLRNFFCYQPTTCCRLFPNVYRKWTDHSISFYFRIWTDVTVIKNPALESYAKEFSLVHLSA